jgi:prepilin-type N-terminal cleavage/methylation domain-containing protein
LSVTRIKPLSRQAAFTLLELIIVILILAIMAAYVQTRPSSSNSYKQDTVVEQIISSARLAQQLHMNDSSYVFRLVVQANQIDLQRDGASFSPSTLNFPLNFGANVTLAATITPINFDRLGATTLNQINITIDGISKTVCLESSGYIHRC